MSDELVVYYSNSEQNKFQKVYLLPPAPFIFCFIGILADCLDAAFGIAFRAAALFASAAFFFSLAALIALSRCF